MAACDQIAVPAQDGIRADQQSQTAQCRSWQRVQQRRKQCPVDWGELDFLAAELALQHGDLVSQREDLDVLVVITARQQA